MAEVKPPTDQQVVDALRAALQKVDLSVTTERALRKQLQEQFGVDLTERKPLIREEVERFLTEQEPVKEDEDDEALSEGAEEEAAEAAPKRGGGAFGRACALSEPMQAFLGEETMARNQVVKRIWAYIKEHDLQHQSNRQKVILDDQLATIFTNPVTIFTMNRQLSKHVFTADGGSAAAPRKRKSDAGGEEKKKAAPRKRKSKSSGEAGEDGGGRKSAGGFTKEHSVSPELAAWCGKSAISRPEVSKFFFAYIKENGLQDPQDRRYTLCDDTLQALTGQERLLSFGVMKHLKQHFV